MAQRPLDFPYIPDGYLGYMDYFGERKQTNNPKRVQAYRQCFKEHEGLKEIAQVMATTARRLLPHPRRRSSGVSAK